MVGQEKLQPEILQSRNILAGIQRHVRSGVQGILNAGRKILKFVSVGSLVALTGCGAMSKSTSLEDSMQTMRGLVAELGAERAGLQDDGSVINCGENLDITDAQDESENANTEILGPGTETTGIATRKAGGIWIVCSKGKNKGTDTSARWDGSDEPEDDKFPQAPSIIQDEFNDILRLNKNQIYACYNELLKRNPKLGGKLTFKVKIDSNGNVSKISFPLRIRGAVVKTLISQKLEACIASNAEHWKFTPGYQCRVERTNIFKPRR